jgi:hypothetical protein
MRLSKGKLDDPREDLKTHYRGEGPKWTICGQTVTSYAVGEARLVTCKKCLVMIAKPGIFLKTPA